GTSWSVFLFCVGFGFEPLVMPDAFEPVPVVPVAAAPEPPVAGRLFEPAAPLAGTSLSVFVVEPGLLPLEDGACAEAAVTPNASAEEARMGRTFIVSLREKVDGS